MAIPPTKLNNNTMPEIRELDYKTDCDKARLQVKDLLDNITVIFRKRFVKHVGMVTYVLDKNGKILGALDKFESENIKFLLFDDAIALGYSLK